MMSMTEQNYQLVSFSTDLQQQSLLLLKRRFQTLTAKLSSANLSKSFRGLVLKTTYRLQFTMLIPWVMFLLFYFLLSGWSQMCNSIPNLSTACRGSIVEVAKITSVSMKTNQYSVTRSIGTWKYATRPHCLRNLISVVLKNIGRKTKKKKSYCI